MNAEGWKHCDGEESTEFGVTHLCVSTTQQMTCSASESMVEALRPSLSCREGWVTS